jgi:hypothetical protein
MSPDDVSVTIVNQPHFVGYGVAIWDGRDDKGRQMSADIYLVQLRARELVQSQKVVLEP